MLCTIWPENLMTCNRAFIESIADTPIEFQILEQCRFQVIDDGTTLVIDSPSNLIKVVIEIQSVYGKTGEYKLIRFLREGEHYIEVDTAAAIAHQERWAKEHCTG